MSAKWNGLDLQTRLSEELWDTSTAFKSRVLDWINDGIVDITDRHDWQATRREGRKVLTALSDNQDLNLAQPSAPVAQIVAGGTLVSTNTYQVLITFYESSTGRESIGGVASNVVTATASNGAIALSSIAVSLDPDVTSRKIYVSTNSGEYLFYSSIDDNTTTTAVVTSLTVTYDTPGNFTFASADVTLASGTAKLVDLTPTNEEFLASLATDINVTRGNGTKTGTATGGAAIVSSKLDLTGGTVQYVTWPIDNFTPADNHIGAIRLKYTPNYTGSPGSTQVMFQLGDTGGNAFNTIEITHLTGQQVQVIITSAAGANIVVLTTSTWSVVSGTEYEIELNYDVTAGATRIFADGVQIGSTNTSTGARDTAFIDIVSTGRFRAAIPVTTSNFSIRDIQMFDAVQHTSAYTKDAAVVPSLTYNTDTDITVEFNTETAMVGLQDVTETSTLPANTSVQWIAKIGPAGAGSYYYHDGASWVASSQTFATSNTAADFNTNTPTAPFATGDVFTPVAILNTSDGVSTPTLTSAVFDYFPNGVVEDPTASAAVAAPDIHAIKKLDGDPWIASSNTPLNYVSLRSLKRADASGSTGTPWRWAQLTVAEVILNPAPTTALTISYYYFLQPPVLSAQKTSKPIIPAQLRRCLEAYVIMRGYQYRDRDGKAEKRNEYYQLVEDAIKRFDKRANKIGKRRDVTGDTFGYEVT